MGLPLRRAWVSNFSNPNNVNIRIGFAVTLRFPQVFHLPTNSQRSNFLKRDQKLRLSTQEGLKRSGRSLFGVAPFFAKRISP
jgi:hypothetical protein